MTVVGQPVERAIRPAAVDSVVRSVCGRDVERVTPLTDGGMNETYRVECAGGVAVIVRNARQPVRGGNQPLVRQT